ncbi:hypothetical protein L1887_35628 [Cichorium endivia]|nr:hypothetical protein L1887_35628 [Cichorium endivia]
MLSLKTVPLINGKLDEAVRAEIEEANQNHENGVNDVDQSEVPSDNPVTNPTVAEKATTITEDTITKNESLKEDNVTLKVDKNESLDQDNKDESLQKDNLDNKEEAEPNSTEIGSQVVENLMLAKQTQLWLLMSQKTKMPSRLPKPKA